MGESKTILVLHDRREDKYKLSEIKDYVLKRTDPTANTTVLYLSFKAAESYSHWLTTADVVILTSGDGYNRTIDLSVNWVLSVLKNRTDAPLLAYWRSAYARNKVIKELKIYETEPSLELKGFVMYKGVPGSFTEVDVMLRDLHGGEEQVQITSGKGDTALCVDNSDARYVDVSLFYGGTSLRVDNAGTNTGLIYDDDEDNSNLLFTLL